MEAPAYRRALRLLAAMAAAIAVPSIRAAGSGGPAPATSLSLALSGIALPLLLVTLAVGGLAWGWVRQARRVQRDLARQLQAARAEQHALAGLLDLWQWRSDAEHRIVSWRPPTGATAGDWQAPSSPPLIWEHFQADPAALRARLERRAPLDALPAWHANTTGQRRALLLRGTAILDDQGLFAGYQGTARECGEGNASDSNALADTIATPVLRVALGASGASPAEVNTAAASWLALGDEERRALDLNSLLKRLPESLQQAVQEAIATPAGSRPPVTHDGWTLRVHHRAASAAQGDAPTVWLMFHPETSSAGGTPEADRADHAAFGYTVSHDLRAPIRVVEGFTRIVKEDYGRLLDRVGNDHLDRVLGAAARMNNMIDSLLALSQLSAQPLSRQPIDLSQLAAYIVDDLRRESPGREVVVEIEPGLLAYGDATLMRVALENLLGNAWKYTGKCPMARIGFERTEHEGRSAFLVRDNGAGFDMRFADRLFGAFQRLHSASDFQGTGVGLASVRRIVRRHGGDIWAKGEVDRGACFYFWID